MSNYIKSPIVQEGNKFFYLDELLSYFPNFSIFIEPFCGTGNVFLNIHNCYKIINDHNKLIYWIFSVLQTRRGAKKVVEEIINTPMYMPFLKNKRNSLIKTIAQSMILSRVSFLGYGSTIKLSSPSSVNVLLDSLTYWQRSYLKGAVFTSKDYNSFLNEISFREKTDEKNSFVYCDPPYVFEKGNHHSNSSFNENDLNNLLELLNKRDWKYAISCRNKGADFFSKRGLFIEKIGSAYKKFKKNNNEEEYEFLAMNYKIQPELF